MAAASRRELGAFLRSRREKLSPKEAGIVSSRPRRTPGLRREEVAELAGIGVDWYIRLEQGRSVRPSAATIDALARALRLDAVEHAHLRKLARAADAQAFSPERVPAAIRRVIESLASPAYVTGRRWDILAWNAAAAALFHFACVPEEDRNVLLYMFTREEARYLFGSGWAAEAKRMVAQFRSTHDVWAGDPAFVGLVDHLRRSSAEFAVWWEDHDLRNVAAGQKVLHHPQKGRLSYEYASFQANDDPALRLVIYAALPAEPPRASGRLPSS